MCGGGNKLLRSPSYGHSKTWGIDRWYSKSKKKKKGGRCCHGLYGRYDAAKKNAKRLYTNSRVLFSLVGPTYPSGQPCRQDMVG